MGRAVGRFWNLSFRKSEDNSRRTSRRCYACPSCTSDGT